MSWKTRESCRPLFPNAFILLAVLCLTTSVLFQAFVLTHQQWLLFVPHPQPLTTTDRLYFISIGNMYSYYLNHF